MSEAKRGKNMSDIERRLRETMGFLGMGEDPTKYNELLSQLDDDELEKFIEEKTTHLPEEQAKRGRKFLTQKTAYLRAAKEMDESRK